MQPKSNFIPDLVTLRVLMTERMVQQKAGPAVAVVSPVLRVPGTEHLYHVCYFLPDTTLQGTVPPLDSV